MRSISVASEENKSSYGSTGSQISATELPFGAIAEEESENKEWSFPDFASKASNQEKEAEEGKSARAAAKNIWMEDKLMLEEAEEAKVKDTFEEFQKQRL